MGALYARAEISDLLGYGQLDKELSGEAETDDAAVTKVFFTELNLDIQRTAVDLEGASGIVAEGDPASVDKGFWQESLLWGRGFTISAGSNEVMRNMIAERQLGLPRYGAIVTAIKSEESGEAFHLVYSEDERLLRDTCRKYLDTEMPLAGVRRTIDEGLPPEYWAGISSLGWPGVVIPETYGGHGYGVGELAVIAAEHGRSVAPGPLLSSSVFAVALATAAARTSSGRTCYLGRHRRADRACSLDVDGALGELTLGRHAEQSAVTLTGTRRLVAEAAQADYVVVDVTYEDHHAWR